MLCHLRCHQIEFRNQLSMAHLVSAKWRIDREWVPEEIWKATDVLAKLLTSLYKICDQSVGKRVSHLYISQ